MRSKYGKEDQRTRFSHKDFEPGAVIATSHTYNETTAEQVFESARNLPSRLRSAINLIRTRYLDAVPEYGNDSESSQSEKGDKR